jgi:PQQ-dependent catabolism-associated CXXCW motif protein
MERKTRATADSGGNARVLASAIPVNWLIGGAALVSVGLLFWWMRPAQPPAANQQQTATASSQAQTGRSAPTRAPTPVNHADELTDWNIPAQTQMQSSVGTRTPLELPGAKRINTQELLQIASKSLLIDVLNDSGQHITIPGAVHVPGGGNYGNGRFDDRLQRNLSNVLATLTNRNAEHPIVFFCVGAECWESYNAALRAMRMGYNNVLWYRGGIASWKAANQPLERPAAVYRVR